MGEIFRFSPRPNRAREIRWRPWGPEAFLEASSADKPILLNLTAVWCHWCHLMDETTYSDADLIQLINEKLIPVRVDADQYPHVQDRYIAGGWPTNAFLTPTGEVLWSGTYVPVEQFTSVANGVLEAWHARRSELQTEIERRRKALEAARGRHHIVGLVRREAADDVLTATVDAFDARNGGFGTEPKFPYVDALELLLLHGARGNADYLRMAEHTLDGMLAGELWDNVDGGFFRYATAADWSAPRYEKLLAVNASLLRIYALAGQVRARAEWRQTAERIVAWVDTCLRRPDGLWSSSQAADPEYYAGAAGERGAAPPTDPVLYTSYNAQWIRALADAGGRLDRRDWIDTASAAFDKLCALMQAPGNLFYHYSAPGETPRIASLLADVAEVAQSALVLARTTGRPEYLERARQLAAAIEQSFWAEDGGFWERTRTSEEPGMLRYRDKPFDLNADCARFLNALFLTAGERGYRALAERILALLSPQAGRYGVAGASFAIAVDEFFDPPVRIVVVGTGPAADALRQTALQLPLVNHHVWSMPAGGRVGQLNFPVATGAVAYIAGPRGTSPAISEPTRLQDALGSIR